MTISIERQIQTNWCWAACVRMAAAAFGRSAPSQAALATQFSGASGCESTPVPTACNIALPSSSVGALFRAVGLAASSVPSTQAALIQLLKVNSSIVLLLLALDSGNHFVLASGLDPDGLFEIADPHFGTFSKPFDYLNDGYQTGGPILGSWRITTP